MSDNFQPNRLEQIEALLLQTNISLNRLTQQQELNSQAMSEIQSNQRELQRIVQRNSEAIAELGQQLESSISGLIETIDYAVESTEQLVMRVLGQSSNGHDEQ